MIFKLLPLIVLLGIGIRFLAKVAAVNAQRKSLQAQQAGRVDQNAADKKAFWLKVDRACLVIGGIAAIWYVVGIVVWLYGN
ncbi:MAG: hypothetical protein ACI89J_000182 [Hyphomicrobiaceae bacterium]|jgi:hypothetical protein